MSTNSPHPPHGRAPRLLNLRPNPVPPAPVGAYSHTPLLIPPLITSDTLAALHRLAELHRLVFPEYPQWRDVPLEWDEEAVILYMQAFLDRVNRLRFPVMEEVIDYSLEEVAWRLEQIPVNLQGFNLWYMEEWDYYNEPIVFLLKLAYIEHAGDGRGRFLEAYPQYTPPADFALSALLPALRQMAPSTQPVPSLSRYSDLSPNLLGRQALSEPWDGLPVLVSMVTEETGNRWLDYSNEYMAECGCYPQWEADYQELLAEWQEAAPQLAKVQALINEVQKKLPGSLDTVWELLLAAYDRYRNPPDEDTAFMPNTPLIRLFKE
jgi:hypothetical protein